MQCQQSPQRPGVGRGYGGRQQLSAVVSQHAEQQMARRVLGLDRAQHRQRLRIVGLRQRPQPRHQLGQRDGSIDLGLDVAADAR